MGKFHNIQKMITASEVCWKSGASQGLMHIRTRKTDSPKLRAEDGLEFVNMVSCSYLGLNRHPKIRQGAMDAIEREGVLNHAVSRVRIAPKLLDEAEAAMSELFGCEAYLTPSCFYASATMLPLLASGHLSGGEKPVMLFDKNCHFSMNIMKAICADETQVETIAHNDMNALEDACKKYKTVVYVCDGAYSTGGFAPVADLLRLQDRYGLYLHVDDSHSLSACGKNGRGLVRPHYQELGDRTIIVGSLAKSFGSVGGIILVGTERQRELINYSAGPTGWSQQINVPAMGAAKATALLHMTDEVAALQKKLQANLAYLDSLIPTKDAGNGLPIRVIEVGEAETAIEVSEKVFHRGFYTSAVFFPIVARGRAGLRMMMRADMEEEELRRFCSVVQEAIAEIKKAPEEAPSAVL